MAGNRSASKRRKSHHLDRKNGLIGWKVNLRVVC
jgi:hypothetical protein